MEHISKYLEKYMEEFKVTKLADFKNLPVGTKLLTVRGARRFVGTVREIAHKQTNAIKFVGGSWLEYPRASEFKVVNDAIVIECKTKDGEIWNILEYKIVK